MIATGLVQRLKGALRLDNQPVNYPVRLGPYQELFTHQLFDGMMGLNEEGSFFTAVNPTPETPIAVTTSIITYAETAGAVGVALLLRNTQTPGPTAKKISLSYIKLMIVQVPTSATHWKYVAAVDSNPIRYTSGGSLISSVYNMNSDGPGSIATLYFGALTTAVPVNRRYVGRGNLRGVIPTTFDQYMILFGWGSQGSAVSAAASGSLVDLCSPCVLSPGENFALTMWGIGNAAAPSFEFAAGWIER